ncbi:hypothetical protein glysoja_009669 [Glycine soja]|nr:hypothetical protein glysoja_009669 [Glycine soja]
MEKMEGGFPRLASFVCNCEPFSEEELQAIEASLSNPNNKRPYPFNARASSFSPHTGWLWSFIIVVQLYQRMCLIDVVRIRCLNHNFCCPFKDCSAMLIPDVEEVVTVSKCPHCKSARTNVGEDVQNAISTWKRLMDVNILLADVAMNFAMPVDPLGMVVSI